LFCMRIYAVSFPWVVVLYAYLRYIYIYTYTHIFHVVLQPHV